MAAIPVTIFFSLLLAGLFVTLFAHEQHRRRFASPERDSLLPLADEESRPAADHHADHAADGDCRCRRGARPPCAQCLARRARAAGHELYF